MSFHDISNEELLNWYTDLIKGTPTIRNSKGAIEITLIQVQKEILKRMGISNG